MVISNRLLPTCKLSNNLFHTMLSVLNWYYKMISTNIMLPSLKALMLVSLKVMQSPEHFSTYFLMRNNVSWHLCVIYGTPCVIYKPLPIILRMEKELSALEYLILLLFNCLIL